MDQLTTDVQPVTTPPPLPARVWKFWGTTLWGLFVFAAMFIGQMMVIVYVIVTQDGAFDVEKAVRVVGGGTTISLSVVTGLPAVVAALWFAIRWTGTPFSDYLGLFRPSWKHLLIGLGGLALLVLGWDLMSRATGREITPGFMVDVLKSARYDGTLWLLFIGFCIAAPISEELFARGFLYRGWSESRLGPWGAILLSSAAWTTLHLQYDWYFFGEIFCIGIWFGWLRHRYRSIWITIVAHALNNFAAVLQTIWLAGN